MRIVELLNNITLPITNEEANLLDRFNNETPVLFKSKLDEREQLIANSLVNKDVLLRLQEDGRIAYKRRIQQSK